LITTMAVIWVKHSAFRLRALSARNGRDIIMERRRSLNGRGDHRHGGLVLRAEV
jgi:hypothetical protein